jgi:hypothetical protein
MDRRDHRGGRLARFRCGRFQLYLQTFRGEELLRPVRLLPGEVSTVIADAARNAVSNVREAKWIAARAVCRHDDPIRATARFERHCGNDRAAMRRNLASVPPRLRHPDLTQVI